MTETASMIQDPAMDVIKREHCIQFWGAIASTAEARAAESVDCEHKYARGVVEGLPIGEVKITVDGNGIFSDDIAIWSESLRVRAALGGSIWGVC